MKKLLLALSVTLTILFPVFSLSYPEETQRTSINIAKNTSETLEFFLEKQTYDPALAASIAFYPLDNWYFENFLKGQTGLELQNATITAAEGSPSTASDAYLWYQDIANGNIDKYSAFAPYAQYIVAMCLKKQEGTIRNYSLARQYIKQSYSAGFAGGYYLLAKQKEEGWAVKGTDPNKEEALYSSAASQNFPEALLEYAALYEDYSNPNAKKLLKRAQKFNDSRAFLLDGNLDQAASLGNPKACMQIAENFENKKDYDSAIEYYTLAATYGECEGFASTAKIYREGLGGQKDSDLASFFYYQYRDAKYEKESALAKKIQDLREFYEFENNEPDETVCRDLGIYYYLYPDENSTMTGSSWFSKGADKGSAECILQQALHHKKNSEGLSLYKQAVAESNAFPLGTKQLKNAYGQIDDIYAQVLQASRFKNNVLYWKDSTKPKQKTVLDKAACRASSRKEALSWFKSRMSGGDLFMKTWYAWILLEDMNAESYKIPSISKRPDKDVKEAFKIVTDVLSKDPEYAPALVCQGRCYQNGYGTSKKLRKATDLYQKAIDLNYSEAYGFLANALTSKEESNMLLYTGCRLLDEYSLYTAYENLIWTPNITDMKELIEGASNYGYTPAFLQLVDCYIRDTAVTFDKNYEKIDEAHMLASQAEVLNITDARTKRLYIERYFSSKMNCTTYTCSQQIAEARENVQRNKSPETTYSLAQAYDNSHDLLDNTDSQAAKYYLMSAEQGNIDAMKKIADFYCIGRGISPSYEKAFKWYSTALENGSTSVYEELGAMYLDGKGCEREVDLGIECYRRAVAENPDSKVLAELNCFDGI
ncbi:MAG: sel1 repeat family protein [Treponema sp.]|nr:sel1 repeat family protein [Treponema sp.]